MNKVCVISVFQIISAEKAGALGVILYNDPKDNVDLSKMNATYEDTFPNSWYLPPSGVELGVAMDLLGDPLTPGFPSKGTDRLSALLTLLP